MSASELAYVLENYIYFKFASEYAYVLVYLLDIHMYANIYNIV